VIDSRVVPRFSTIAGLATFFQLRTEVTLGTLRSLLVRSRVHSENYRRPNDLNVITGSVAALEVPGKHEKWDVCFLDISSVMAEKQMGFEKNKHA
jgi:hypothetical protein